MGNTIVKSQLEEVQNFLAKTNNSLEEFLNETTLSTLSSEHEGHEDYYKAILSNLRKLLVYCEESAETCLLLLQGDPFQKAPAEKTLYKIYHQCIEEFFSPKNDAWTEDSRSAYTGQNSIKFYKQVPERLTLLMKGLEGDFQKMREDLEYYETDYRTKMLQSK